MSNNGSDWLRWDLHVHAPGTKLNNNFSARWNEFLSTLATSNISGFGITDYFSLDCYEEVINRINGDQRFETKVFFPVVEFRLREQLNTAGENINLHILFNNSPETLIKAKRLLSNLETSIVSQPVNKKCSELLSGEDFSSATVKLDDVVEKLKDEFGENSHEYMIICAYSGRGGIRPNGNSPRAITIAVDLKRFINIFFGTAADSEYWLEQTPKYPVITGSDCHSIEDMSLRITNPDGSDQNRTPTWIKAEATFEGLRQIMFEPKNRIKLQINKPRSPQKTIDSISLDISEKIRINELPFCYSGTYNIDFNPRLNCIIGGRGAGKSTLLSMIAEKMGVDCESTIIEQMGHERIEVANLINIRLSPAVEKIEFYGQNTIQKLAESPAKLTDIVLDRLKNLPEYDSVSECSDALSLSSQSYSDYIRTYLDDVDLSEQIQTINTEIARLNNIKQSVSTEEYRRLSESLDNHAGKLSRIKSTKSKAADLIARLREIEKTISIEEPATDLETDVYNALLSIHDSLSRLEAYNLDEESQEQKTAQEQLTTVKTELEAYLIQQGIQEEDLKELQSASERVHSLSVQMSELAKLKQQTEAKLTAFNTLDLTQKYDSYKTVLTEATSDLSARYFSESTDWVSPISFSVYEDESTKQHDVWNALQTHFEEELSFVSKPSVFQEIIFNEIGLERLQLSSQEEIIELLQNESTKKESRLQAIEIFSKIESYELIKRLAALHCHNSGNLRFEVKYDNRPLDQSSFGQRCTAAILILLSLGTNPIIIDEPEAHLDSALIANHLVELLKIKSNKRQVIFATHNANFVINGDADLIISLNVVDGRTEFTPITIEDLSHRDQLMKLEGGPDAFKLRGDKYAGNL